MSRTENVELTALCLIHRDGRYLLQDSAKEDWPGYVFPGGHIEKGESIVDAVIREMKEETGLTIRNPRLRGVKQFPIEGGRYLRERWFPRRKGRCAGSTGTSCHKSLWRRI